jgi:hypothetical protein
MNFLISRLTLRRRRRVVLAALATAGLGAVVAMITVAPTGCSSNCGSNCPITEAIITAPVNVDPGIIDLAWIGPACPPTRPMCRGDDNTTLCTHINVYGVAEGYCDVLIQLAGRDPMAVRVQFGAPGKQGCCQGYPVVGDWYFTIPLSLDAGIYGSDGSTDAVRILRDAGTADATDDGAADASGDSAADDGATAD